MTYRELTKKLKSIGCHEIPRRGGGSHRKWVNPVTGKGTVVPDWGSKDLKQGTIRGILRQLGIDIGDFKKA
ncbi:MAG: type II toxin-antitoxin system HicA family toxin [Nitrospinota bacterium]